MPRILLALGIGLCGYYGTEWYEMPRYSQADIDASVELNLQLDLQRRGALLQPDEAGMDRLRTMIREEVEADINRDLKRVQTRFGVGLIALVVGISHLVFQRMLKAQK